MSSERWRARNRMVFKFGDCEFCRGYSPNLRLYSFTDQGSVIMHDREKEFFFQPLWMCYRCVETMSRVASLRPEKIGPKEEDMDSNLLSTNDTRSKMVRRLATLQHNFSCVNGIYLLPTRELPERFHDKMNIMVSFKNLCILQYYRFALDHKDKCLMHFWKPYKKDGWRRSKFWSLDVTRLLVALSRIHCQSEMLAIWIWTDTRIVSVEFFCKTPARMIQTQPTKILKID